jgi:hypothetical protein
MKFINDDFEYRRFQLPIGIKSVPILVVQPTQTVNLNNVERKEQNIYIFRPFLSTLFRLTTQIVCKAIKGHLIVVDKH